MTVNSQTLKQQIIVALDMLSFDSLKLLFEFLNFLRFRSQNNSLPVQLDKQQLAADYDELATMYAELVDELNDDLWLPAENEVAHQVLARHLDYCK